MYANKNNEYFTRKEALETLRETLNGYNDYYCDLQHHAFNEDYYIVGRYFAKKALEEYGVFNAIEEVERYERDNFGEIYTSLSDPEKVANMLWYVIGDNVTCELFEHDVNGVDIWNDCADDETNAALIARIDDMIEKEA